MESLPLREENIEHLSYCEDVLKELGYDPKSSLEAINLAVDLFIVYAESEEEDGNAEN